MYSLARGRWQGLWFRRVAPAADPGAVALFGGMRPEECIRSLRRDGFSSGLQLPAAERSEILQFATTTLCARPDGGPRFRIAEVEEGLAPDGRPLAIADVCAPESCAAVGRIARDPRLLDVVSRYLRFRPARTVSRLFWSLSADLADDTRRALGQTIDFHYDIESFNGLYVYFYITPTDRDSGAHVVVRGSHRRKPLSMKLSSCFQPQGALLARYGANRFMTVEGPAGFGFLEAPECFHKALPPCRGNRLVLQIRYS